MGELINNEEMMKKSGKEHFAEILKSEEENYNDLKNINDVDRILEKDSVDSVSKASLDNYKKLVDESDNAGDVKRFGKTFGGINNYLNASRYAKYSNLSTEGALNKNYVMPLDEKGLKKLKGRMEDAKKTTGLFDKIHEQTKKYAIWMVILCALLPFAIPAMLAVGAVILAEYAVHEAVCQYEYNKVIKPLTVNGKNPYKNMLYSKGYKKLDELTAEPKTIEDVIKSLTEAIANEKDPKAREQLMQTLKAYLKEHSMKLSAEQSAKIGNVETNEVKGEQKQAEDVKEETVEKGKEVQENAEPPFNQDEETKEAQEKEGEIARESNSEQLAESPEEVISEESPEIVVQENNEDKEVGREQKIDDVNTDTVQETKEEEEKSKGDKQQNDIENFFDKPQIREGLVSGDVVKDEEVEQSEDVKVENSVNNELNVVNERVMDSTEVNDSPSLESENLENVKEQANETQPMNNGSENVETGVVVEQPQDVEEQLSSDVEPEIVEEQLESKPVTIEIDYLQSYTNDEELKQSFNNNAERLRSFLEGRVRENNDNEYAKADLELLNKLSSVFDFYMTYVNGLVAKSYFKVLNKCIENLNAKPEIKCVFDAEVTKDINSIYQGLSARKPALEARKEKENEKNMQKERNMFNLTCQYVRLLMENRNAEVRNVDSENDLKLLKSIEDFYKFSYETKNYDICTSLKNIVTCVAMQNKAEIEKRGSFFNDDNIEDLKVVNTNVKFIKGMMNQEQLDKNEDNSLQM